MHYSMLEGVQVDCLITNNATNTASPSGSAIYSREPLSMAGYDKAELLISVGTIPTTGDVVHLSILGGTANCPVTAMAAITNATVSIGGGSTAGTITKAKKINIHIAASNMSGTRIMVLDGSSFLGTAVAVATVGSYAVSTASTAIAKSLATVIKVFNTKLDATYTGTTGAAATAMDVQVWPKGMSRTITLVSTGQEAAEGLSYQALISQGAITIRTADLLATNSSYTDIGVLVLTSRTSAVPFSVHAFRQPMVAPPDCMVFHKKDLTTSGAK